MTRLEGARSEQVATVHPSPPLVVSASNTKAPAVSQAPVASPPSASQEVEQAAPVSPEAVEKAAKQLESYLKSVGRQLEFRVDESTGRTVITVKDSATGEVIRQIPGEESLRLARMLGEQTAALIDLAV